MRSWAPGLVHSTTIRESRPVEAECGQELSTAKPGEANPTRQAAPEPGEANLDAGGPT
ncbi:MAG: hypothetical protein H0T17_01685 [Propionibacteriales bacterium]|nr:hypothetical protein [Propionibacteriales bacterium]